jgi:hypothetical protein
MLEKLDMHAQRIVSPLKKLYVFCISGTLKGVAPLGDKAFDRKNSECFGRYSRVLDCCFVFLGLYTLLGVPCVW